MGQKTIKTQGQNVRYEYLDFAKGFTMMFVIWGHVQKAAKAISNTLVYSFHMPVYFIVSGMLFNKEKDYNFGVFLKRRLKSLIIPYLCYGVVTWFIWAILRCAVYHKTMADSLPNLLQLVFSQGSSGYLSFNTPLWFVLCLFLVEIVYYFISKLPDLYNVVICSICAIIGVYLGTIQKIGSIKVVELPWSIDVMFKVLIFYCLGNMFVKYIGHFKLSMTILSKKILAIIMLVIFGAVQVKCSLYYGHFHLTTNNLGKSPIFYYGNSLLGTLVIFMLGILLCSIKSGPLYYITKFFNWMGRNSFKFMAVHCSFRYIYYIVLYKLFGWKEGEFSENYPKAIVLFLLMWLSSIVVVCIINAVKKAIKNKKKQRKLHKE